MVILEITTNFNFLILQGSTAT